MENYTYPRVSMSTTALKRSSVGPAVEDTTVLFAPIMASRGPNNEVVVCHSLSEFIDIFGDLDYEKNKLQAFNVYNWLSNGGTVYARRLTVPGISTAAAVTGTTQEWVAKYPGSWYNKIEISVVNKLSTYFDIFVKYKEGNKETVLESFHRVPGNDMKKVEAALSGSKYIKLGSLTALTQKDYTLTGAVDGTYTGLSTLDDLVEAYFSGRTTTVEEVTSYLVGAAEEDLGNKLETPIDIILDACFSAKTKEAIFNFIAGSEAKRSDIIGLFDLTIMTGSTPTLTTFFDSHRAKNIAVYDQNFVVYDAIFSDMTVRVGPSYFLSKLIPFNDLQYGIQFPTAGLRRGILADALEVNYNPRPAEKENLFKNRINYVEKTSREYAFMSQRTHDGSTEVEYDALSFLNNARCLEKMKKELERLGREYLFEFNDSVTLSQLSNILNKYMGSWVSNRTLSYALVDVQQDLYSTEKVNIYLSIRFAGTIEVISVDITIE